MRRLDRRLLADWAAPLALIVLLAALQCSPIEVWRLARRPSAMAFTPALFWLGVAAGQVAGLPLWRRRDVGGLAGACLAISGIAAAAAVQFRTDWAFAGLWLIAGVAQGVLLVSTLAGLSRQAPQRLWGLLFALVLAAWPLCAALAWLETRLDTQTWHRGQIIFDLLTAAIGATIQLQRWPGRALATDLAEELAIARRLELARLPATRLIERPLIEMRTWLWVLAALALAAGATALTLAGSLPGDWDILAWLALVVGILAGGLSVDRFGAAYWLVGLGAASGGCLLVYLAASGFRAPQGALILAGFAIGIAMGGFWPVPLRRMTEAARPLGLSLISAASALGLALGQAVIGWARLGGQGVLPLYLFANLLVMSAAMMLCAASFDLRLDAMARQRPTRR